MKGSTPEEKTSHNCESVTRQNLMAVSPIPYSLKCGMNRCANSLEWWEYAYLQMICTQRYMIKVIIIKCILVFKASVFSKCRKLGKWDAICGNGRSGHYRIKGVWIKRVCAYGWCSPSVAAASYYFAFSHVKHVELHTLPNLFPKERKEIYHF